LPFLLKLVYCSTIYSVQTVLIITQNYVKRAKLQTRL
jgi:hypothetical protein